MKIVAQINVYNSEEYIWYVLKSLYDFVDRIVVIDGAFRDKMPSKYSTDRTQIIVEGFDDPLKKVIYLKACSDSQLQQRNLVFDFTSGMDWLFLVDDDEVYKARDLQRLRSFLESGDKDSYRIRGYNFVNSFEWYYITDNMRLWKIKPGMYFKGPNTVKLKDDENCYSKLDSPVVPKIIRFHYSYVRDVKRLAIKRKQIKDYQGKKFPWRVDGEFITREAWARKKFVGSHPKILATHPYRSKVWNPK